MSASMSSCEQFSRQHDDGCRVLVRVTWWQPQPDDSPFTLPSETAPDGIGQNQQVKNKTK